MCLSNGQKSTDTNEKFISLKGRFMNISRNIFDCNPQCCHRKIDSLEYLTTNLTTITLPSMIVWCKITKRSS